MFVAALETMFGGFRERADATYGCCRRPGTAFVVVAAPEPDALREAALLRRAARPRTDAAGRAGAQPGARSARAGSCPPSARLAAAEELDGAATHALTAAAAAAARRADAQAGARAAARPSGSRRRIPRCRWPRSRRRPRTCTTSTGCARIGDALAAAELQRRAGRRQRLTIGEPRRRASGRRSACS